MGWNGSGSVNRTDGTRTGATTWADAKAASVNIVAADHDTHDEDLADAIENCIAKDGQNTPTADLPMNGQKHTGVGNAAARNQYAAVGQIQDSGLVYATSGGSSNAFTLTLSPAPTAYTTGMLVLMEANHSVTSGTATINVNSLGAKSIVVYDKSAKRTALLDNEILSGGMYHLAYDGTDMILLNPSASDQFVSFADTVTGMKFAIGSVTAAGSVQGDATALAVNVVNYVSGADGTKGVILPAMSASAGDVVYVLNNSSSALKVYPASGDALGSTAPNGSISISAWSMVLFIAGDSTRWFYNS